MKKFLSLSSIILANAFNAQVGINTEIPKATLDVSLPSTYNNGSAAGITFPQLSGDQIEAIATNDLKAGTLVYATQASTNTIKDVDSIGYWYWTGDATDKKWEPLFLNHKSVVSYFYAPSVSLPTTAATVSTNSADDIWYEASTQKFRVKLFEIYKKQYSLAGNIVGTNRTAIKNPDANNLPTLAAKDLDYFVTYFDNKVFDPNSISLDNDGLLTYQVINNASITEDTFMNIVFKVK